MIHQRFSSSYIQPVQEVMLFTFLEREEEEDVCLPGRDEMYKRPHSSLLPSSSLFLPPPPSQGKVAQTACMSACKHISTSLMQLLLDPEVRQISMGALHQIHTDVKECESECRLLLHPISDSFTVTSLLPQFFLHLQSSLLSLLFPFLLYKSVFLSLLLSLLHIFCPILNLFLHTR